MQILLLGGTGFLGRMIARTAIAQGHDVTCLARGNGERASGATFVQADRERDDAFAAAAGTEWDAVVDLTSQPAFAKHAVRDLRAEHWIYVSSSSAYARGDVFEQAESAETLAPLENDRFEDMAEYGSAKVSCETVYREHSPSHTIVRSGLIGGEGDHTARSGYYPWRFAHPTGSDVIVPDPTYPIAMIDVADLSEWIVLLAGERHSGTFNATGVSTTLGEVLELSRDVAGSDAIARVVETDTLDELGVAPWMGPKSLPLWVGSPEHRCFGTLDTTAARAHGLKHRPLRETLAAALAYEETRDRPRRAGLTDDEERALRAALDAR